ncbi:uncharacterized protein Z519_10607 [Cladophialophora bantiana CBS 173.52]|uniref:Aldehyde dehydrogenase domain-containing protein n=1 Tax=Cladophialophora bantiana (strain ATCC 10958 / CBS 173.52 / CDC B-1940 / NIH 8579) TaxID=1442370 RepID=A0A0D2EES2_CLAB1|nr:uncharacterized protein Z519_10607 [Cladophialophora bantiana CBS 173.52]KIW88561.1 hypothetical protein Z519_10607 [Cladophialophora bantiana CBS 173.52]
MSGMKVKNGPENFKNQVSSLRSFILMENSLHREGKRLTSVVSHFVPSHADAALDQCKIRTEDDEIMGNAVWTSTRSSADEMNKSQADAGGEVMFSTGFIEWYAEECPLNFLLGVVAREVVPALVVECTVIVKSGGVTPFSANVLAVLAERTGVPAGGFNVIAALEGTPELGLAICKSDIIKKPSFTGSTGVGKILSEQLGSSLKKLGLELGCNEPFLVFDDADLGLPVSCLFTCKLNVTVRPAGRRIESLPTRRSMMYSATKLAVVKKFRIGPSQALQTIKGLLIGRNSITKMEEHIQMQRIRKLRFYSVESMTLGQL